MIITESVVIVRMYSNDRFYSNPKVFRVVSILFVLCIITLIAMTSFEIYLYSKEPCRVEGQLMEVEADRSGLIIYVDGERYRVYKSRHTNDTFGILMNFSGYELTALLENEIGSKASIEYIKTVPNVNKVVNLTIRDLKYVDRVGAIRDNVQEQKTSRILGIMMLVGYLALYLRLKLASEK